MPKHYRTCNLCEAMCGLEITYEGNEVLSIKGDKADSFSEGHICPKAYALKDVYEDKDRLKRPVKRVGNDWVEISWKQAFEEVTTTLVDIQKEHGNDAVGVYSGNPNVHNSGSMLSFPNFSRELKTKNRFSATSVDQLPHQFVSYLLYGHQLQVPVPDIDRTDYLVILGANPLVSNGSLMSAPNIKKRLERIQDRGGKVINIDPRFTETSAKADQHIYIRPGTDVYLLLAMLHTIFDEDLIQLKRFESVVQNLDDVRSMVDRYSADTVSEVTGVPSEVQIALTREFCNEDKAVLYGRMGICTQEFGGFCMWLVHLINIVAGKFDEPGGYMFTTPAIDVKKLISKGHINRWQSRVRGLPEIGSELPSSVMAEEILTPGDGQIRAMIINAGNPVLSTPNGVQLEKAFKSLDFIVSIDIYINETSSLANIILPPTTGLEVDLYDLIFHTLAVRNTTKYSPALFAPDAGAKHDWQIFRALKKSLLKKKGRWGLKTSISSIIESILKPEKMIDLLLRKSKYKKISVKRLKKNPHGIDLGPLKSQMPEALYTTDKLINLFPDAVKSDINRMERRFDEMKAESGEFLLIGRRQLRTCNSWLHNSQRLVKNNRCDVLIHPKDVEKLNLNGTKNIRIKSKVGEVIAPYKVTEDIMIGTISLPHGWGHHGAIEMEIAASSPGININALTDDQLIDQLTGNAALNGVPVTIEAVI